MLAIKQKISNWINELFWPTPCSHTNIVTKKCSHFNMIIRLDSFKPEHWPNNSPEQIQNWKNKGCNVARIMQLHNYCTECGQKLNGCHFILESPYFRTKKETEVSLKATQKVAKLVR